jgi:hypothetical protein
MFKNPYNLLRDLLPEPALQVGTVLSITSGLAVIEQPGGGISQARGEAAVGDKVFFRNGVIESLAPNLPIDIIEI